MCARGPPRSSAPTARPEAPPECRRGGTPGRPRLCDNRQVCLIGGPCKWGPGPTPPVRGRWPGGPEGVGRATMSTKCSSKPSPVAFCPIPRCSRRSPAKRVRREEEEQGNERSFRRQAETEWSGLCDDEPPWAKSLAARRRRNPPARNETALSSSPHPSRLRRATFPYPLCRFATSPLDKGSRPPRGRLFWGGAPSSAPVCALGHLPPGGRL